MLTARSLGFTHREHAQAVFSSVDLTVETATSLAIVGPSGSGKTTLLHLLAGLIVPSTGEVTRAFESTEVSWIVQSMYALPARSVFDNVGLECDIDHLPASESQPRIERALHQVQIEDLRDRRAKTLSGGEGQRLAVARVLASRRPVVFADEPTGQLDATNADNVARLLSAETAGGRTVIVVTHDMSVAARFETVLTLTSSGLR